MGLEMNSCVIFSAPPQQKKKREILGEGESIGSSGCVSETCQPQV